MLAKLFIKLLVFTVLTYNISSDVYSKNTNDNINNNKLSKNNKTIKSNKEKQKNNNIKSLNNNKLKQDNNDKDKSNNNNKKDSSDLNSDDEDTEENGEDTEENDSNEDNNTNENDNNEDNDSEENNNDEADNTEDDEEEGKDNDSERKDDDADKNDNTEYNDTEGDDTEGIDTEEDNTDYEDMKDSDNEDDDTEIDDDDELEDDESVDDPFEKFNREVFEFNDTMNKLLDKVTSNNNKDKSKPSPISKGIGNFSHNFFEAPRVINYTLQGNVKNASNSIARLMINTIFGFFGVTDIAEKLGFEKKDTNFGDTLKKWGMKPGPYVVLPILGPTSLRGTFGLVFETLPSSVAKLPLKNMKPFTRNAIYYGIYCCSLLSKRAAYGDMIEQVSAMSKDKYKTFRNITMSSESN